MKPDSTLKFERIYALESDAIFRFCLLRVSNREQAKDLTQETFLRLWESLTDIEKDTDKDTIRNKRAFLFTVAHRLIIDWYRKKKSISLEKVMKSEEEENDQIDLPDEKTEDMSAGAEGRYLLGKLNELSPGARQPVYLRYVEGLTPGEIGDILGITPNAASVRINRGLEELRKKTGYDIEENNNE